MSFNWLTLKFYLGEKLGWLGSNKVLKNCLRFAYVEEENHYFIRFQKVLQAKHLISLTSREHPIGTEYTFSIIINSYLDIFVCMNSFNANTIRSRHLKRDNTKWRYCTDFFHFLTSQFSYRTIYTLIYTLFQYEFTISIVIETVA